MQMITNEVARHFNVEANDLISHIRDRNTSEGRQVAMYFTRRRTSLSLKEIGKYFGGRHHSTVIYGTDTVKDLMFADKNFKNRVKEIDKLV